MSLPLVFCMCTMCVLDSHRSWRGSNFHRTRVMDVCEPLCGCRELNLCPLTEEKVPLTTENSLQGPSFEFLRK